ncbi:MAG: alpha/beta hydrolase [Candidatus Binatia bacterium]
MTMPRMAERRRRVGRFLLALVAAGSFWNCSGTQLLNNLSTLSPGPSYSVERDILFDGSTGLKLDVYAPKKAAGAPVVVFFFPGRWSMGDKADYRFVAEGLVSRGMIAVLPNYRLYPEVRFPAFVEDAAQAVQWTHEHVAKFGGDPDRLFVMGHSSGAHLAALLALDDAFLARAGGNRGWLKGMIGLSGPYDFKPESAKDLAEMFGPPEKYKLSQPIHYVDGSNPPLLLLHGHDDNAVNVQNTISLTTAVERAGGTVETVLYPKLGHGLMVASLASYYRMPAGPLDKVDAFVHARMDVVRTARAAGTAAP